jgi:hypothetical protein
MLWRYVHVKIKTIITYYFSFTFSGAPGYISMPHFLNADEKFVKSVNGLEPDKNLHNFLINFEPVGFF